MAKQNTVSVAVKEFESHKQREREKIDARDGAAHLKGV